MVEIWWIIRLVEVLTDCVLWDMCSERFVSQSCVINSWRQPYFLAKKDPKACTQSLNNYFMLQAQVFPAITKIVQKSNWVIHTFYLWIVYFLTLNNLFYCNAFHWGLVSIKKFILITHYSDSNRNFVKPNKTTPL